MVEWRFRAGTTEEDANYTVNIKDASVKNGRAMLRVDRIEQRVLVSLLPRGSKYPVFEVSDPNNHTVNGI